MQHARALGRVGLEALEARFVLDGNEQFWLSGVAGVRDSAAPARRRRGRRARDARGGAPARAGAAAAARAVPADTQLTASEAAFLRRAGGADEAGAPLAAGPSVMGPSVILDDASSVSVAHEDDGTAANEAMGAMRSELDRLRHENGRVKSRLAQSEEARLAAQKTARELGHKYAKNRETGRARAMDAGRATARALADARR